MMQKSLAFVLGLVKLTSTATIICWAGESCLSTNLTIGTGYLECLGYRSCAGTTMINSGSGVIKCSGSYACHNAYKIERTSTTDTSAIHCHALASCANVGLIKNTNGPINCYAEQSCMNSTMVITGNNNIFCQGDHSCANSRIFSNGNVDLTGNLGGLNTIVLNNDTNATTRTHYFLTGFESGKNLTIICGEGNTCYVNCYGKSCHDLIYKCSLASDADGDDDDSCTLYINCDSAQYDDIHCPNGYIIPNSISDLPSLMNVTMSTFENTVSVCNSSDITYKCNNWHQATCYSQSINTRDNPSPICCNGAFSCEKAKNITGIISSNSSSDTAIRCDAFHSCSDVSTFIVSEDDHDGNINGRSGNIYATAINSIGNGAENVAVIRTSKEYDIFCTANGACDQQYFENGRNLYCNANLACGNATMVSNFDNVFSYGNKALQYSNFKKINNIYCGGSRSCFATNISNIFDSVYGSSFRSLSQSKIRNVLNNVIGMGLKSLYESIVYNVSNIYCISTDSCANSTLRAIHNKIHANGDNVLSGSIIISETNFDKNGSLYIYINGTNDHRFDIYCNETDKCFILCQTNKSCVNLVTHCGSNDEDNADKNQSSRCVMVSYPPTSVPTSNPTDTTTFPSVFPSSLPTNLPSSMPSSLPSRLPSLLPSRFPSVLPTHFAGVLSTNATDNGTEYSTNISSDNTTQALRETTQETLPMSTLPQTTYVDESIAAYNSNVIVMIVVSAVIGMLLLICIILLFFIAKKVSQKRRKSTFAHKRGGQKKQVDRHVIHPPSVRPNDKSHRSAGNFLYMHSPSHQIVPSGSNFNHNYNYNYGGVGSHTPSVEMRMVSPSSGKKIDLQANVSPRDSNNRITPYVQNNNNINDNNNNGNIINNVSTDSIVRNVQSEADTYTDAEKEAEGSLDRSIEDLLEDLIIGEDHDNDDLYKRYASMSASRVQTEGKKKLTVTSTQTTTTGGRKTTSISEGMEGGFFGETGNEENKNGNFDVSNFETWTQKEVIIWLKWILIQNTFDNEVILSFLREFGKKYVTGRTLKQFQKDSKFVTIFQKQFSKENQEISIWIAVTNAINEIGK